MPTFQSSMNKEKKKKSINVKPIKDHNKVQIDIKKDLHDDKKIKPEKVFEGYKKSNTSSKKKKSKY